MSLASAPIRVELVDGKTAEVVVPMREPRTVKGVVRDVHVGYSPNLRKELGDKIRELLAEEGTAGK